MGIGRRIGGWVGDRLRLDDVLDVAGVGGNLDAGDLHSRVPWRGPVDHWPAVVVNIVPVKVWSLEASTVTSAIKFSILCKTKLLKFHDEKNPILLAKLKSQ